MATHDSISQPARPLLDGSVIESMAKQVAYGIYYFARKEYLSNAYSAPMISASIIKVFIMEYIFANQLDLQRSINGEPLNSLLQRMIQISDNEATNAIIDQVGMDALNQYFLQAGYTDTKIQRKMLDTQAQSQGIENYTSLPDTMEFLKRIYSQQARFPYGEMLKILLGQQIGTKLRSKLPEKIPVANKTGELSGVENDIGLVFAPNNPFAIVVLSNGVYDRSKMREAIGKLALAAM
ncbi:serine hydrolase [Enterococcus songbeiensis]|uniref:serine hydrolase n=1 Tax=Enterococcus songbeiensis TaxID=2559927 RepID=UPI0014859F69|nr:serine hydrolase [Enterococcus songbeiensis]